MVQFSVSTERQLYQALKGSFPDAKVGEADMLALAICLRRQRKTHGDLPPDLAAINLDAYAEALDVESKKLPASEIATLAAPDDDYRYYWVQADHVRHSPDGFAPFTGELGMVRVRLHSTRPKIYHTAFGVVAPGDHLIDTVYEANQKYSRQLGYEMKRLDLITPARQGLRFGAISVLLGFRKASDRSPSCYILEAGTATGQPKVLYLGKEVGRPINAYSGYSPTPFACPSHAYLGTLTVKESDEPDQLKISSRVIKDGISQQPYIDITITWLLQTGQLKNIWPGFLLARATAIVLGRVMKKTIPTGCDDQVPGAKQ
jgi:hypothetical protein